MGTRFLVVRQADRERSPQPLILSLSKDESTS